MMQTKEQPDEPEVCRVVRLLNGPTQTARLIGGNLAYQEVSRWTRRGWVAPLHAASLQRVASDAGIAVDLERLLSEAKVARTAAREARR